MRSTKWMWLCSRSCDVLKFWLITIRPNIFKTVQDTCNGRLTENHRPIWPIKCHHRQCSIHIRRYRHCSSASRVWTRYAVALVTNGNRGQPIHKIWSFYLQPFQGYFRGCKILKLITWPWPRPLMGQLVTRRLILLVINRASTVFSFNRSKNI